MQRYPRVGDRVVDDFGNIDTVKEIVPCDRAGHGPFCSSRCPGRYRIRTDEAICIDSGFSKDDTRLSWNSLNNISDQKMRMKCAGRK